MTIVGAASRDVLDGVVAILFDGRMKAFPVVTERMAAVAKANVRNMLLERGVGVDIFRVNDCRRDVAYLCSSEDCGHSGMVLLLSRQPVEL